ncbi:hypothetical protein PYCCODRAFT_1438052 [Trametes coccinea BRFM310]|uniref:AB hydrolase-1 domain-containing protein n=1 Tax=Trametes coccinea (strain BRFM310) TaxID=1353009 RepID=A0A1Y2IGD7_TRAC3|nr:hypothetical protein PYCCODRAFT_1438052 [Trametes coccinea BRFM310]
MTTTSGLFVFKDSGVPEGRDPNSYTTVVVVHGYVWHGAIFSKLFSLAQSRGVRIILLNRREYPGAKPYTPEERALLPPVLDTPPTDEAELRSGAEMLEMFMQQRARELYDTLQELVVERQIPPADKDAQAGGIILVGWSLGSAWMNALLSHVGSFPVGEVALKGYIRRVIWYDTICFLLGYPYPSHDPYNPLWDSSLTYEERGRVFTGWVTAYFSHGDTPETFERRKWLKTPPSTLATMSKDDLESTVHIPPGVPGGADWILLHDLHKYDVFRRLKEGALYLSDDPHKKSGSGGEPRAHVGDEWRDVEVRYVWCDHSVWEVPYAVYLLREELDRAKKDGGSVRRMTMSRLKGANHFAQWDHPAATLESFLTNTVNQDVDVSDYKA